MRLGESLGLTHREGCVSEQVRYPVARAPGAGPPQGVSKESDMVNTRNARRGVTVIGAAVIFINSAVVAQCPPALGCWNPSSPSAWTYDEVNVVQMFDGFTNRGHSLLLTANIQSTSIASDLLKSYPKSEKQRRVLNLLDFGQLSKVHKNAIRKLKGEVRKIMG